MKALFLELRIFRYLTILLCLVWMAVAPLMPVHIPMQPSVINGSSGGNPALLQFSAAGHVLGFQASGVTIASTGHALRIEFIEANRSEPVASKPAGGRNAAAGFAGSQGDLSASMPGAPPLNQVTWYNLWDGISLTYQVVSGGIAESVYTLEPGAAVDAIRLRYNAPVRLNGDGSLSTIIAQGQMIETAPIAWQQIDGQRIPVQISYRLFPGSGSSTALVGFSASGVDEAYPLTIDPQLRWVVSLGGSEPADNDQAKSIAVDASGNVYLAGFSQIPWGSSPLRAFTYDYDFDAFVVKLDASGVSQWNTFLGGIGDDRAVGIAVDGSGNILVVGQSDESWGSPVRAYGGAEDVWVARLDSSGNLSWNTFLGSTFTDDGYGIAVNTSGDAFVAGYSTSSWGSPVTPFGGGGDAFVAELAGATGDLVWSTFVGGTATDYGKAIVATDTTVYLTGSSKATWGASPKRVYSAGEDAFVASLDADGRFGLEYLLRRGWR